MRVRGGAFQLGGSVCVPGVGEIPGGASAEIQVISVEAWPSWTMTVEVIQERAVI